MVQRSEIYTSMVVSSRECGQTYWNLRQKIPCIWKCLSPLLLQFLL